MSELIIFVDSERPDQYLNSVVHCVLERDVRAITFLHIESLTSTDADKANPGLSARVMGSVQAQLENLAERQEYLSQTGSGSPAWVNLNQIYGPERALEIQNYYQRVRELSVVWTNKEVAYEELRHIIKEIATSKSTIFIDVTAVKKRYLGDIVATGLVEGLRGLWTFDLLVQNADFSSPWTMLIHHLRGGSHISYRYTNLLDTEAYRACARLIFVRVPRYQRMAYGVIALIVACVIGYLFLGEDSKIVKLIMAVSSIASIAALVLVFTPPRTDV